MGATHIQTLKPNVTQQEALHVFSSPRLSTVYWRLRRGPLRRIADAYVPYRLYRAEYHLGRAAHSSLFAIDAVNGSLDLFTFPRIPDTQELMNVLTRNGVRASLPEPASERLLHQKVLRVIFQQGFFKVGELRLQIELVPVEFHIPYWLGFYGHSIARCRAMDAVRRRIEGAKASALFESWLAA